MTTTKNSKIRTNKAVNSAKAVELRIRGLLLKDIAAELGCSVPTVSRWLGEAAAANMARKLDGAEELRQMELAVLMEARDRALVAWGRYEGQNAVIVEKGESYVGEPIDAKGARLLGEVRQLSESIRKLLGLDAPELHQLVDPLAVMTREDAEKLVAGMPGVSL